MSQKTLLAIAACLIGAAAAFTRLTIDISSVKEAGLASVIRMDDFEARQRVEHDNLLRMEEKLDYLVDGRRGNKPPTASEPH